jgi:hypothetical protein
VNCAESWVGNERARWCICPGALSVSSVVYFFGVGEDVSFELEMIRQFGVRVHAFDPTPRSIDLVSLGANNGMHGWSVPARSCCPSVEAIENSVQ